jgi:hypothetical protein
MLDKYNNFWPHAALRKLTDPASQKPVEPLNRPAEENGRRRQPQILPFLSR